MANERLNTMKAGYPLTFTGGSSVVFDGTSPQEVYIPEKWKKIWEYEGGVTSQEQFVGQTLTIPDLSKYSFILVIYKSASNSFDGNYRYRSEIIRLGDHSVLACFNVHGATYLRGINTAQYTENQLKIEDSTIEDNRTDNRLCIPIAIYGIVN